MSLSPLSEGDLVQVHFRHLEGMLVSDKWNLARVTALNSNSLTVVPLKGTFLDGSKAMALPRNGNPQMWK